MSGSGGGLVKKRWKPWIWVAVAVVMVAAVLLGVGLGVGFGGEGATGITYTETVVNVGTVSQTVFGSGTLAPPEQYEVRAASGGTVTSISVEEGQLVVPGQELFRIDGAPVYALGGDYSFYRTIRSSSDEGDDITALQTLLADLGFFTRDIDGEYCWYSQEAVRDFLEAQDEDRTSRVGPDTFQTVGSGSPRVLSLQVSVGDVVLSGQTVMVTAPDGPMEAKVLVNELDISLVEPGQRVELSVDALPSQLFSATVQARSYSPANETGSSGVVEYPVTVLLDDVAPEVQPRTPLLCLAALRRV
jgi:multidrug efflux pump subunit AcrA (membrane-fusion protein)